MSIVPTKTEIIDLFWRSTWTFIVSFIAAFPASAITLALASSQAHITVQGVWVILAPAVFAGISSIGTAIKVYASNKLGTGTATTQTTPVIGLQPIASNSASPAGTQVGIK